MSRNGQNFLINVKPQTLSSLNLPYNNCQISHSAIMPRQRIEKSINYDELLKDQQDENVLIVDVREECEIIKTGQLPGSIHIPMSEVVDRLNISVDDFEERHLRNKPTKDTKIILSCQSGYRSSIVCRELHALGYNNVYNYTGGWQEWESKQRKLNEQK